MRLLDEGRFEEALASFDGNDIRSTFGRAAALHMLGRLDEAEMEYEAVLDADPAHDETLSNLIALNVERFQLQSVERYALRLLAIRGNSQIALRGMIVVAVERGDLDLAANCFARLEPPLEKTGDAVEYRLSRQVVDRLKDHHASVTHPH